MFNAIALVKILVVAVSGFVLALLWSPLLTDWLYRNKFWKQKARELAPDGSPTPIFNQMHKEKEVGTPRAGGLLVWLTVLLVMAIYWSLSKLFPDSLFSSFDFVSRRETWLPLFTLVVAGIIGFVDDYLVVRGKGKYIGGGLSFTKRVLLVIVIGLIAAWWFYFKLGADSIYVPLLGSLAIGWLYIPLFVLVMLAVFSSGVVDGLDGLSGGVFSTIFTAYTVIAFARGQYDLAAFSLLLVGTLMAYLWFNIPPARFYMGETGVLALTSVLTVMAFLTNTVLLLPIIGIILVLESGSVAIQLLSKKFRGKKVFLVAPIHHHFEALGWPAYKVTMRFWVISALGALAGVILALTGSVLAIIFK
ncbi:MAG: hypothetical protein V1707_00710 [bacterium]